MKQRMMVVELIIFERGQRFFDPNQPSFEVDFIIRYLSQQCLKVGLNRTVERVRAPSSFGLRPRFGGLPIFYLEQAMVFLQIFRFRFAS